jgi:prevent-host-death family protein
MRKVGIRELKAHMSEVIAQVQSGETIEVTNHGEAVALMVPVRKMPDDEELQKRQAALTSLDALRAEIARHVTEPTDVTQLLREMRDSR